MGKQKSKSKKQKAKHTIIVIIIIIIRKAIIKKQKAENLSILDPLTIMRFIV